MADKFYVQGQEKLQKWIERVKAKSADNTELYKELGNILLEGTHNRFETGKAPDGRPWQKSWRAKSRGEKTLLDRGILQDSIYAELRPNGVSLSSKLKYARILQNGGVIRAKNGGYLTFRTPMGDWVKKKQVVIPARPFLGVSEDDAQEMLNKIVEHYEGLLKNA